MITEGILGALVGGSFAIGGALVQGLISRKNTIDRIEAENDRRVGEYYLKQKVEVLTEYHAQLEKIFEELGVYQNQIYMDEDGITEEEFHDELTEMFNTYYHTSSRASVFLTENQEDTLSETADVLRKAHLHLQKVLELDGYDDKKAVPPLWHRERQEYAKEEARDVVKEEIQKSMRRLEE
mgnify:CR=1 FL=1